MARHAIDEGDVSTALPTTPEEIRAAFDDVPRLDQPSGEDRWLAERTFPDAATEALDSVPDPHHDCVYNQATVVPPWVAATAYCDAVPLEDPHREEAVRDTLMDHILLSPDFQLVDGRDAVEAIISAAESGGADV